MGDENVVRDGIEEKDAKKREIFLRFHYIDLKETFKQLFTLNAGVFAFSATIGQKPAAGLTVLQKLYFFAPYGAFVASLIVCSIGYYILNIAGDKATNLNYWGYSFKSWDDMEFHECYLHASKALEISGYLFMIGLLLLAITTIL